MRTRFRFGLHLVGVAAILWGVGSGCGGGVENEGIWEVTVRCNSDGAGYQETYPEIPCGKGIGEACTEAQARAVALSGASHTFCEVTSISGNCSDNDCPMTGEDP